MIIKKFSDLSLYFTSVIFSYSYYWIALAIPYLQYRGLTNVETFSLMAAYQLIGVVVEYPTSVLGDRYGYRRTVILGNIFSGLSMFMLARPGDYWYYFVGLTVLGLATSLMSGNEQGLLKELSKNVRKDTAKRSALAEFILFINAIIGGWLGGISYTFALTLSGSLMFSAIFPLLLIKRRVVNTTSTQSIKTIILDGFKSLSNKIFQQIFLILAIYGGFFFTIKSIFGSFGDLYNYPLELIGFIVGAGSLARALGSGIYTKYDSITKFPLLTMMAIIIMVAAFSPPAVIIGLLLFFQVLVGYVLSSIDGDIQDLASDHIRSSLFAFKRLIMKLFSSGYLFLYGLMLDLNLFTQLMFGLGIIMIFTIWVTRNYTRVILSQK